MGLARLPDRVVLPTSRGLGTELRSGGEKTGVAAWMRVNVLYEDSRLVHLTAPYLSGFLAFREVPFLVDAVQRLQEKEPSLMPQAGPAVLLSPAPEVGLSRGERVQEGLPRGHAPPSPQADIRSRDYIRRTLGGPRPPAPGQERKAQRPNVWPKGGPEEPPGEGRTPEAHSPGLRTHPGAPDPGAQEQ
ncbi:Endonuclease V [Myotis davidii]|uniref:Endonuclease V n=1 Tax=Myotis davidii TaxID=225400 RepID=L5MIV2_MYODS|nr:Endonuclease V [Myotis davidii]